MRIVSMLSSATEIVYALGLDDHLVAISHECDYPPEVLDRPRLSRPRFDPTALTSGAVDAAVRQAMREHGIAVVETKVGDRYVLEALEEGGWSLGGEQSGHVIFRDLATTGDGILTGLQVLDVMQRSGRSLAELSAVMTRLPQVLRNVAVLDRQGLDGASDFWAEVEAVRRRLGADGRVLVRPSGTEPVVRVMVEAPSRDQAQTAAESLAGAIGRAAEATD